MTPEVIYGVVVTHDETAEASDGGAADLDKATETFDKADDIRDEIDATTFEIGLNADKTVVNDV